MANLANVDKFKSIINTDKTLTAQIKNSLKEKSSAFISSVVDLYSTDNSLQKCDPQAVALECVKAALIDLPLVKSLGFAYVVPYKNKPTFTIGYKGLIQLAQRTGQYKTINTGNVYEGELLGVDKLSGTPDLSGERTSDNVIGYFAYFKLLNGYEKSTYMSKEDMIEYADNYSPSFQASIFLDPKQNGSTPWYKEFDKMAQKTLLRQLISKYGPMSVNMVKAIESDDVGKTPHQEVKENANKTIIDVEATDVTVDTDTGEVINDIPDEPPMPEQMPFDMYE
jgi:recombination protein RecT